MRGGFAKVSERRGLAVIALVECVEESARAARKAGSSWHECEGTLLVELCQLSSHRFVMLHPQAMLMWFWGVGIVGGLLLPCGDVYGCTRRVAGFEALSHCLLV